MAALKVTLLSPSSSTIYGKSHSLVDKWVRRISSNTSSTTNSIVRVRVLMSTERRTKGFPTTIGKSAVRSSFRWRGGWRLKSYPHILGASDEGLAKNLRSYSQNSSSSGAIGSSSTVTEVNSENKDDLNSSQFEQPEKKEKELEEEEESEKLLTLPTILTIARVAAVPLLISTFYMTDSWATTVTTSIFVAAAITDWLDGYLARKMQLGTAFGAFLDPVADKLMVAATLVLLCTRPLEVAMFGEMPWLLPIPSIAIIGREITMSAVREWAASQNGKVLEAVAVNNLGKWKTATQMTALTVLLATRDSSLPSSGSLVASGVALLYVSAGLAVWSLFVYMKNIWRVLLKK